MAQTSTQIITVKSQTSKLLITMLNKKDSDNIPWSSHPCSQLNSTFPHSLIAFSNYYNFPTCQIGMGQTHCRHKSFEWLIFEVWHMWLAPIAAAGYYVIGTCWHGGCRVLVDSSYSPTSCLQMVFVLLCK